MLAYGDGDVYESCEVHKLFTLSRRVPFLSDGNVLR